MGANKISIVKDLSDSFSPLPKDGKQKKPKKQKEEFCIMPKSIYYSTKRTSIYCERHEVFEGRNGNRNKSIKDGLVIFLTHEQHRTGKKSVHLNPKYWKEKIKIQKIAEEAWIKYNNKTQEDFKLRYGENFL